MPPPIVNVDLGQFNWFAKDVLERIGERAIPYAVRNTLNAAAFEARTLWQAQMDKAFVLRNTWTKRSIGVEKASGLKLSTMHSVVGSRLDYMKTQEEGGSETAGSRHGVPIPTPAAAGQAAKAKKRTKQVRNKNWMSAMQVEARLTSIRNRAQRNVATVKAALKTGGGVVYMDLGKKRGLFRVEGTPKGRARVRMVWDLSRANVRTKPHPTLEPVVKAILPRMEAIARAECIKQVTFVERMVARKRSSTAF